MLTWRLSLPIWNPSWKGKPSNNKSSLKDFKRTGFKLAKQRPLSKNKKRKSLKKLKRPSNKKSKPIKFWVKPFRPFMLQMKPLTLSIVTTSQKLKWTKTRTLRLNSLWNVSVSFSSKNKIGKPFVRRSLTSVSSGDWRAWMFITFQKRLKTFWKINSRQIQILSQVKSSK